MNPFIKKNTLVSIFLATFIAFVLVHFIIGFIPVGNGAGWDGETHLSIVKSIVNGDNYNKTTYQTMRTSALLPLFAIAKITSSTKTLIYFQMIINITLLSLSACCFYASLIKLELKKENALLSLLILIISFPFIIHPVYYPISADSMALIISCFSLWCWTHSHQKTIYILTAYAVWVLPGTFVTPFILAIMPLNLDSKITNNYYPKIKIYTQLFFYLLAVIVIVITISIWILHININESYIIKTILKHVYLYPVLSYHLPPLMLNMLFICLYLMIIYGLIVGQAYIKALFNMSFWQSINWKFFIYTVVSTLLSIVLMRYLLDWSSGLGGPPLLINIFFQSIDAPLKVFVSHFAYYGPVSTLILIKCVMWAFGKEIQAPNALIVIMLIYLPMLFLGSESRQFIGVFPIMIAIFAVSKYPKNKQIICLFFSVLLLIPAFYLRKTSSLIYDYQLESWQIFFSRIGPWMSVTNYQILLIIMVIFLVIFYCSKPIIDKLNNDIQVLRK